jgi:hypothetical protein
VSEPAARDLVGIYRLTTKSEAFLRAEKGYLSIPMSSIELRPERRIAIRNLPDCAVDGFGDSRGQFLSAEGQWQISKLFVGYGLTLEIAPGGSLKDGVYGGSWMAIRGRSAPHVLEVTVGDPDSGETIQYARGSS